MTKSEMEQMIADLNAQLAKVTAPTQQMVASQPTASVRNDSAESILNTMGEISTIECKLLFVAPSVEGKVKLVVSRGGATHAVYCYNEVIDRSNAVAGDMITILAEYKQSKRTELWYWNATAVSKR